MKLIKLVLAAVLAANASLALAQHLPVGACAAIEHAPVELPAFFHFIRCLDD